jgi:hypothetical protein
MPHDYEWGLFFHLLGVFALGGAVLVSFATFSMMRRAATVGELRTWGGLGRILSQYFVIPAAALELLLSGAYLVDKFNLEWTDGWIGWSVIALVAATAVGFAVITPRMKQIGAAVDPAPDGPVPSSITSKLNDPILFGAIHMNLMLAIGIIYNMTTKPGGVGSFLALVILGALGAAAAFPLYQRQQREAATSTSVR